MDHCASSFYRTVSLRLWGGAWQGTLPSERVGLSLQHSADTLLTSSLLLAVKHNTALPFVAVCLDHRCDLDISLVNCTVAVTLAVNIIFDLNFNVLTSGFSGGHCVLLTVATFTDNFVTVPLIGGMALIILFFTLVGYTCSIFTAILGT